MKPYIRHSTLLAATAVLLAGQGLVNAQSVNVTVDPSQNWVGYMNVFNLPADGGGYVFGSSWGTSDLRASFAGPTLTLAPNINVWETTDTFWVKGDGVSPNKNMDANMYVESDPGAGSLGGNIVNFAGLTLANTLVSPYTSVAFIKDFTPSFSLVSQSTISLVGGQGFNISLATHAGDVVQYGFETIGPDANPATVAGLGSAEVTAVPEPGSLALLAGGLLALPRLFKRGRC
jgi:hypothetical protein